MSFANTLLTSLHGVTANKLRAALTTLGIIIGVAAVIAMLALGNGARAAVEARFRSLGADQVQIGTMMALENGELAEAGKILSFEDGLRLPEAVPLVRRVDISTGGQGKVRYGRAALDMPVTGVTADALEGMLAAGELQPTGWPAGQALTPQAFLAVGRFFSAAETLEGAGVCVLGWQTAQDLFGGDDPLGETVWVNRQRCQVIGVLAELESIDESQRYSFDPNKTFFLPVSTAIRLLFEDEPSVQITAHVRDEGRMDEAKAQIAAYLRQRHNIQKDAEGNYTDDFNLTTRKDVLGAQQDAARTFSLLLAAMAVVSLAVGGIGIMNVMLVSVSERTREIGVRMSLGARPRDITAQFLLEATLISAGGGLLGVAVGVLCIPLAAALNQGQAALQPDSIPLALGVALLTGLLSGMYPALRAARLDPIEALRYE
jgi:ABC-type antimicrobial peptide transport system permease subunit